ncbi:MAG: phosphoglycerate kinase [Desulfobacteraceae bacterium]
MKTVKEIEVTGKTVLVRADYNVPVDENGAITDDNRIAVTIELIDYLLKQRAKVVLASHMGRPGGKRDNRFSLKPVAARLAELVQKKVEFVEDCIGDLAREKVKALEEGEILLLENLRFHKGEKSNDPQFARELASLCDVYVNEAFAVSHRDQASVTGITEYAPVSAAGFVLEKEIRTYYDSVRNPKRPLVAIIGGAKVSGKLEALRNMLNYVDRMIVGGAMANTFLKSSGIDTRGSMVEEDLVDTAAGIMLTAEELGIELLLPTDLVAADSFSREAESVKVPVDQIPSGWMGLDIGPETAERFAKAVENAGTIVWNGPMGVFEMEPFMAGTRAVAEAVAGSGAFSIVGGGDTGLAVKMCGLSEGMSYISTGGGAFLHLMEGKELPGVKALN